jgi:adhesin transport system membrane fusion protein
MVEPLVARGSAPKLELLQLERTLREKTTELNSYLSSVPRIKSAIDEAKARLNEVETASKAQAQTELSAKTIELNEIRERLTALKDRKTRTELKSPVNGTIKAIEANTVGGVVRPGEDIIQIVPKDDQLLVEARIRPADIAFLYPQQKAIVKITAYDFSIYGGLDAEVVDISADTIEDEEGNSFYRVRLRTYENELKRRGQVLPIIPGMVASVDVLTGEKTVMQYLLKPFIKTLDNAMNER